MYIIQTKKLSKNFKNVNALQAVDLALEPGKIYGLVGNNGAGKTTLFRILAGLAHPSSGSFELFGESTPKGLNQARRRVGFLIDNGVYYPTLSARTNLRNVQLLLGHGEKSDVDAVLERVGLDPNSRQLLANYSMGMKQRYGLAAALVGEPELLVLDEPLNGLDPGGTQEINSLLKQLQKQGKTILLSSHLLAKLYETANEYIFMDHGRIIEQISHETLEERCGFQLTVRADDIDRAEKLLHDSKPELKMIAEQDCLRLPHCTATAGEISRILVSGKINAQVETSGISLEDYFFGLLEEKK